MQLQAGAKVGPYEIVEPLGVGGMGEVWRADDARLGRQVALKALPEAVAEVPERLARFEREARTLAGLSHPNIAMLYGLEEAGGRTYLVMEVAEGEELTQRIRGGPLPVEDVVAIGLQIAEALEAAHEQNVVHRDLKPANVKVTQDGLVKVLDFGLAKSWDGAEESQVALSMSPTVTAHHTAAGVILGTASYMSPEQARGRAVDKRADIWSFGVVLWEMLTGRRLFGGETVSDVLASVIKEAPDLEALPTETPARLRELVARCLERDPGLRLRDIGEARIVLSGPMEEAAPAGVAPRMSGQRLAWTAAAGGLLLGALGALLLVPGGSDPMPPTRVSIPLTPAARLDLGSVFMRETFAISPDGRHVAFSALDSDSGGGVRKLWVRDLAEAVATPVADSDRAEAPFYSPDGRWLAFLARGGISRVPATGGGLQTIALPEGLYVSNASWTLEDRIVATGELASEPGVALLWSIDPDSGAVEELLRSEAGESVAYAWPQALETGRAVLFGSVEVNAPENVSLEVLDLSGGAKTTLLSGAYRPRLLPGGDLLYSRDGRLFAAPFDAKRLEVTGPARVVLGGLAASPTMGHSWYEVSANGTLVSLPEEELQGENDAMLRVDLSGGSQIIEGRARYFVDPRVSPDGRYLAFSVPTGGNDIWVHDLERGTQTRLVSDPGEDETPIWSPDGEWVVWAAQHTGKDRALLRRRPDGSGAIESIWSLDRHFHAGDWSSDGERILVDVVGEGTGFDVWILPVADPEAARPLLAESHHELLARFSPDGRWLSYTSNETGSAEVYLQSFPALDRKIQVSAEGGTQAVWSSDGRTLFFRSDAGMWAVDVAAGDPPRVSTPRLLFARQFAYGKGQGHFGYDAAPDGTFVMGASDSSVFPQRLDLFLGWREMAGL